MQTASTIDFMMAKQEKNPKKLPQICHYGYGIMVLGHTLL